MTGLGSKLFESRCMAWPLSPDSLVFFVFNEFPSFILLLFGQRASNRASFEIYKPREVSRSFFNVDSMVGRIPDFLELGLPVVVEREYIIFSHSLPGPANVGYCERP